MKRHGAWRSRLQFRLEHRGGIELVHSTLSLPFPLGIVLFASINIRPTHRAQGHPDRMLHMRLAYRMYPQRKLENLFITFTPLVAGLTAFTVTHFSKVDAAQFSLLAVVNLVKLVRWTLASIRISE